MNTQQWYQNLQKPFWAPPETVFGPVWTVLYSVIFVTFGYVFYAVIKGAMPKRILVPFALNLLFNLLFSPIQFILKNNVLATLDILLVLATLLWSLSAVWPYARWVVYANIPYVLWVAIATALQISITILNF